MEGSVKALGVFVALTFAAAGIFKLVQFRVFRSQLSDLFPALDKTALAGAGGALASAEIVGATLALASPFERVGYGLLLALLVLFVVGTIWLLLRGRRDVACACFGSQSHTLSWSVPARNLLMAVPVVLCLAGISGPIEAVSIAIAALVICVVWQTLTAADSLRWSGELPS